MKNKRIDIFLCISIVIVVLVFMIIPIVMVYLGKHIRHDPSWAMGLAFLVYICIGPVVNAVMGALYVWKKRNPIIVLVIMFISNLILGVTILNTIIKIIFLPMIVFCIVYGAIYMACTINAKVK